ncbi:putative 4-hydroxyphenylacetate degradation bifunctional isomerase [Pseudomonas aeruginosa]|nr:putative 4-hydroxyphenylacetate degradation bifunctional isomerase [Pseudomonas aeruginosa]
MSRALNDVAAGTLFGVALNYKGLLDSRLPEFQQPPYQKPPVKPVLFIKTPNTRNEHDAPVLFPRGVERLQPGPALGVVIARDASRVKEEEAMAHVAGYVIVNEFSLPEDSYYRPAVKAKCRDGFCPFGPQLVPTQEIADPHALELKLYVNGELRQRNNTANLVRDIPAADRRDQRVHDPARRRRADHRHPRRARRRASRRPRRGRDRRPRPPRQQHRRGMRNRP